MKFAAPIRLFAFLTLFISFAANAESLNCQQHQCMAVVDAGSTGTRLHVFEYDFDKTQTPINIKELWTKKIKPGLATLEPTQAAIDLYLSSLFLDAPTEKIPTYFYSTAGMRLLSQPKQKQVYNLVEKWFAKWPQWELRSAKTISGADEGLFAWLVVNHQLGKLNSDEKTPVGVMDMGGASVQIIFPVENTEGLNNSDLVEFELYGKHRKLFIHSFLGLGQTEVSHQYLDVASCFSNNYQLTDGLAAAGDAGTCEKEISLLINEVHRVNPLVQPVLAENPVNQWYVLGGMAELAQTKPFQFEAKQFTNQSLLDQANSLVCQQQWPTLIAQYPSNDYLYGYCLFPSYYYALMVEGYGIQPNQLINYITSNQGGDWPLGVVLRQQDRGLNSL
ncbi:MAG: multidrug DMT transporter permease [Tatlockia sp.]|nr:multidrug DMT transporter permease [Tatlockia sp.]